MIKVLRTGVHIDNRFEKYTNYEPIYGSSTLIVADGVKILVDPSHIAMGAELNQLLKKEDVMPEEIDFIFITHHHLDHSSNMGAFKRAKIFIGDGYVVSDKPSYMTYQDLSVFKLPKGFSIVPTPGHTLDSNSFLYVEDGVRYLCAGDAVREDVIRENAHTAMNNRDQYLDSLRKIFQIADVIIPGHGRVIEGELKKELEARVKLM